jgi:hypothetical protein
LAVAGPRPKLVQLSFLDAIAPSKTRHRWSEDDLEVVRRDYEGTRRSCEAIGAKLGVSSDAVYEQVQALGLASPQRMPWSREDIERLQELIHKYPLHRIAGMMGRSVNSVRKKTTKVKLRLRSRDGGYTLNEVCEILGVDHHWARARIDCGSLRATWQNGKKPAQAGSSPWRITEKDLKKFIITYSDELLGRNVDIQQIVWICAGNDVEKYIGRLID